MVILYNISIFLYQVLVRVAALRNPKAQAWIEGRKNIFSQLRNSSFENTSVIWVHSASTGEFEQAKPVIEALRKAYPHHKIIASFFSPSGYDAAKNYAHIHHRCYLPADTSVNARQFLRLLNPQLVIFSKYDFWHHHIKAVHKAGIPLLLISATFRPGQAFFKWYGGFYRAMLRRFSHLFVQDSSSMQLLHQQGIHHCSISGDTRFDRVLEIAQSNKSGSDPAINFAQTFINEQPSLIAGSTWAGDENLLAAAQAKIPGFKWLIVPHELGKAHLNELEKTFPGAIRLSECMAAINACSQSKGNKTAQLVEQFPHLQQKWLDAPVLIVDAMGLLSRLYAIATITYVGGGFTRDGIHNTLEAAVWGKPVIIGPNYKKYREAKGLIAAGGAFSIDNAAALQQLIEMLISNEAALKAASHAAKKYVEDNSGATWRILNYIQENRLLTK